MIPRTTDGAATCGECGAPLAGDQRYCLQCGARHGAPRVDPLAVLGFAPQAPSASTQGGPATVAGATGRPRRTPSPRVTAGLAVATLVLGGVVGAALGPGPAPSAASAPQRLVALVVPGAAPAPATTRTAASPPAIDRRTARTPSAGGSGAGAAAPDTAAAGTSTSSDTSTPTSTGTSGAPAGANDTASSTTPAGTAPAGTAPAHIWLISLTQLDATAFAPTTPFADLVAQGTFLSNYTAAAPSAAANEIALLGGQVPTADCAADVSACVLPAGETSLPDQITSINLTWRAYVEDAALRCAATPSPRVGVSLFTTLRERKDCATTVVGLDALGADLAHADKTPAFSLIVPTDGTASLHDLVARITASDAYKSDGVLVVTSDERPPTGDPATPLGALVLSPRATAGRTADTATGPVALLRSIDTLLGLDPLATAAGAPAGALDGVLTPATTSTPSTTSTTTTRRSP